MAFELRGELEMEPGEIRYFDAQWKHGLKVLMVNPAQDPEASRLWCIYIVRLFIPNPINEHACIVQRELFITPTMILPEFPQFADLNVKTGVFCPRSSFPDEIEVYTEE